jgi:hypothetical protein
VLSKYNKSTELVSPLKDGSGVVVEHEDVTLVSGVEKDRGILGFAPVSIYSIA